MKQIVQKFIIVCGLIFASSAIKAQSLYFPPISGNTWDTLSPQSLGWCQNNINKLYAYLDSNQTKAFIVLKNGKIVLEKYFGTFTQDSLHYWASAGKSLTAFLIGLAQEQGYLSIYDTTSDYLGVGWTSETPAQEKQITIWSQLTMTSGIDSANCTAPNCFAYKASPGTRWDYNSAVYTMLHDVLDSATGMTLNSFTHQKLEIPTGMTGLFVPDQYHDLFVSTARSAARFGLLMLNKGNWNGTQVMTDTSYFNRMINTAQNINKSYGYLWWLNGKSSYMIASSQMVFPGSILPDAPADMYEAMGKNGQFIDIVPSQNIVLVRLGDFPGSVLVPFMFNDSIWKYVNQLPCQTNGISQKFNDNNSLLLSPNPTKNQLNISWHSMNGDNISAIDIRNVMGQLIKEIHINHYQENMAINISNLSKGLYILTAHYNNKLIRKKFIKE